MTLTIFSLLFGAFVTLFTAGVAWHNFKNGNFPAFALNAFLLILNLFIDSLNIVNLLDKL